MKREFEVTAQGTAFFQLEEAVEVLLQLQYKKEEAREMVGKAFSRKPDLATAEEILNEVYKQKKVSTR